VVAQRKVPPTNAAIIMSLEAVFAALGGWLILEERINPRGLVGSALMLTGMLISGLDRQPPLHRTSPSRPGRRNRQVDNRYGDLRPKRQGRKPKTG